MSPWYPSPTKTAYVIWTGLRLTAARLPLSLIHISLVSLALATLLPVFVAAQTPSAQPPLLLRNPSLSQDKIAFRYADDIWTVSRQGGDAERLTSDGQVVAGPFYSPDGTQIAYSAHLHGNTAVSYTHLDVYKRQMLPSLASRLFRRN